jgi:hypothetical protein
MSRLYASTTRFDTEKHFDYISINGTRYSGQTGFSDVWIPEHGEVTWVSDAAVVLTGWVICGAPPPSPPAMWVVVSGDHYGRKCITDGSCITDGAGQYGNNERCTFRATKTLYAYATDFSLEPKYDKIWLGNSSYSGTSGPNNVLMMAGDTIGWSTDESVTYGGWVICAYDNPVVSPSLPPLSPPPPQPPPAAPGAFWLVLSGEQYCHVNGTNGEW